MLIYVVDLKLKRGISQEVKSHHTDNGKLGMKVFLFIFFHIFKSAEAFKYFSYTDGIQEL